MKIIVDEMPKYECQCLFCKREYNHDEYICEFSKNICNLDMCDYLKPVTDYHGVGIFGEQFYIRDCPD